MHTRHWTREIGRDAEAPKALAAKRPRVGFARTGAAAEAAKCTPHST